MCLLKMLFPALLREGVADQLGLALAPLMPVTVIRFSLGLFDPGFLGAVSGDIP
jgi:hypothetical protein